MLVVVFILMWLLKGCVMFDVEVLDYYCVVKLLVVVLLIVLVLMVVLMEYGLVLEGVLGLLILFVLIVCDSLCWVDWVLLVMFVVIFLGLGYFV